MYLPVDNQSKTRVCPEFLDTLDAVELFIQQCNGKHIILCGDMNLDVSRRNAHDKYYSDWCDRIDSMYAHNLPGCNIDYTYNDPAKNCFTCIDHFTVTNGRKCSFGCNGHVTAVAVGQSQQLYAGVKIFTGNYLSFF